MTVDERGSGATGSAQRQALAIFTIVSNNYLHFARTLLQSVRAAHPEAELYCVIVDRDMAPAEQLRDEFEAIHLDALGLPDGDPFKFQYNILELNTAVKPWAFQLLLDRGYEQIIYLDPDILVCHPLVEVKRLFEAGADIVLTPHLLAPMTDDGHPSELDIRRAGTYNFGFCALRNSANCAAFVRWWQGKLYRDCVVDLDRGIFVDQSWIDLVPGMFDEVAILRHPGYNVAYWNLAQREVKAASGLWAVNGEPLVFFHFSGFDPLNPERFSKHQDRFTLSNLGPPRTLAEEYANRLMANGAKHYVTLPYGYGAFDDGERLPAFFHALYRVDEDCRRAFGQFPYARSHVLTAPARAIDGQRISWAMLALWNHRKDIHNIFPLTTAATVRAYLVWFLHEAGNYFSAKLVDAHRALLDDEPAYGTRPAHTEDIQELFYTVLRRFPEEHALRTYERMALKPNGMLRVWRSIAFSQENKRHPGWKARAWRGWRTATAGRNRLRQFPQSQIARGGPREQARSRVAKQAEAPAGPHLGPRGNSSCKTGREVRLDELLVRAARTARADENWCHAADENSPRLGRWVDTDMRLDCPPNASGEIRIEGWYPANLIETQTGSPGSLIALCVDGACVRVTELDSDGEFVIEAELPAAANRARFQIGLFAEKFFRPIDIGLNDDARRLALRLRKVALNGLVLFDSAAEPPIRLSQDELYPVPGLNIVGYVKAELGVGEASRALASSAMAANLTYSMVDVGYQTPNRQTDEAAMRNASNEKQLVDVLYVNADQTPATLRHLDRIGHTASLRVGFWHWEQTELPRKFLGSFEGLDEVWTPSAFVHEAVSAISPVPVVKIGTAVHFEMPPSPRRAKFGLPERKLLALVMYDFHSYAVRKNPDAAIRAFRLAAGERRDAALVIKTMNADEQGRHIEALKECVADLPHVIFRDGTLSRADTYELQACCDVLVSLHRAEGFGLAPAEFMFMGKPVIATGWSGNMDFMTPMNSYPVNYELVPLDKDVGPYVAGLPWAEADVEHAAWCLRQVMDDPASVAAMGKRAALDLRERFSPQVIGRRIRNRLHCLSATFDLS